MKILVVGGTGLIGSAIVARLRSQGHKVVVASRSSSGPHHTAIDLAHADEASWHPLLQGVDAVVNCAGVLQDAPGEDTASVHHRGAVTLFRACAKLHVRRVIHFSAIGVDRATPSGFSSSKLAGDEELRKFDLDWIILRPSVVIGRSAYGASALIRGLAALPVMPVMPTGGRLQVIWLDDVVAAVEQVLSPQYPGKQIVELAGPRDSTFEEVVAEFRAWMRWRPARKVHLPAFVAGCLYKLGDMVSLLGWRPPVRSTAQQEMSRGALAGPAANRMPASPIALHDALRREPASVQDRWFARMYFVKPLTIAVLSLFWISTGLISLGPGWSYGTGLLEEGGLRGVPVALTIVAGALADLCIGLAIAFRRTHRIGLYAAILISCAYAVIGTILVPRLWADPLGPMLKIWPIIVLHLAALAMREDR